MITRRNEKEIELLRQAGKIVAMTHEYLKPFIKAGISTKKLDELAEKFILSPSAISVITFIVCSNIYRDYVTIF